MMKVGWRARRKTDRRAAGSVGERVAGRCADRDNGACSGYAVPGLTVPRCWRHYAEWLRAGRGARKNEPAGL